MFTWFSRLAATEQQWGHVCVIISPGGHSLYYNTSILTDILIGYVAIINIVTCTHCINTIVHTMAFLKLKMAFLGYSITNKCSIMEIVNRKQG